MARRGRMEKRALALITAVLVVQAFSPAYTTPADPPKTTKAEIDGWMASLSNWGRWGANDQIGTLNLITPAKRRQALTLVKEGIAVSLAHTIDKEQAPDSPRPLGQQMTLD